MKFERDRKIVRQATNLIIDMVNEGALDARQVLEATLGWLNDEDVEEMATANQFLEYTDEDEDE